MRAIIVVIVLTILVVIGILVYRKSSKEQAEVVEWSTRLMMMHLESDVEELREKADKIIGGSLEVDADELFYLSFVLRMKRAKEGKPEHKRDLERIEQLLQLSAEENDLHTHN